ncbi:MAG: 3-methyl-2-oxobutanoate hydroxymethyltransferase [Lachnospiraceae bacterium]|nr:3-methyl-2-oxobutanoate hydroxymethyltransferase [Lachnospiraceae bacterium]
MAKRTVAALLEMKKEGRRISQLTCYDYSTARLMKEADVDTILVGDSLGMTMQGYDTTLPVTMEEMIVYGRSVVRGADEQFVIMDMPFMSYQVSAARAVDNAGRLIKETGANAVKLEGGAAVTEQIKAIVESGIPVCAHIGMTPQSVNVFGGFRVQGKGEADAEKVLRDAFAVQEAGAFMVVLECVPPKLAALITKKLDIITIGIGAGAECDGQVLVWQDMAGITSGVSPKFAKHFDEIGDAMKKAFESYDEAVKAGVFPAPEHTYAKCDCSEEFLAGLDEKYH